MRKQNQDETDTRRDAIALWPVMDTAQRMYTLMTSYAGRMLEFQHEAATVAVAEISAYQGEMLRAMDAAVQSPLPHLHQQNEPKIVELTRAWFLLAAQAQVAMVQILLGSPAERVQGIAPVLGREMDAVFDRRKKSIVINFPDRRAA